MVATIVASIAAWLPSANLNGNLIERLRDQGTAT
jgi:hypothetical protein